MVDAHLSRCAACQGFAADVTSLTVALRSAAVQAPERRVVLPRSRRAFVASVRALQLGAAAAAVMLALGLGTLVHVVRSDDGRGRLSPSGLLDNRDELVPDHARSRGVPPLVLRHLRRGEQEPL